MRRRARVEVTWRDSEMDNAGWMSIKRHVAARWGTPIRTVGIVIKDTKAGMSIASSVHGKRATGVIHIPASCIRRRRRLK